MTAAKPTIYNIVEDLIRLDDMLEAGEIDTQTYEDTLDMFLKDAVEPKLEAYAAAIKEREARAEAKKTEIARLRAAMDVDTNTVRRMKDRLKWFMETTGRTSANAGIFRLAVQANASALKVSPEVEEDPARAVATDGTILYRTRYEIDNKAVREYLAEGHELPWAELHQGTHVRIR